MTLAAPEFTISVETTAEGPRLLVRGEVDLATAPQLREGVLQHLAGSGNVFLDLAGVSFMDSSGLKVLLASQRRATLLGCNLLLTRTSRAVDRLLQVTGTSNLFEFAPDHGASTASHADTTNASGAQEPGFGA